MTKVGALIKKKRTYFGHSQGDLAYYCALSSPQYISNLERGVCVISVAQAKKLIEILNIKSIEMRTAMVCDYAAKLKHKWGQRGSRNSGRKEKGSRSNNLQRSANGKGTRDSNNRKDAA